MLVPFIAKPFYSYCLLVVGSLTLIYRYYIVVSYNMSSIYHQEKVTTEGFGFLNFISFSSNLTKQNS